MVAALEGAAEAAGERTLEALYLKHGPAARRLAYLMTGDHQLSEDLAQDAFIRASGRLGHLRSREGFDAYLRKTVVNLVRMHFRRHRLERTRFVPAEVRAGRDLDAEHDLRAALLTLPLRQRAAIVCRYYLDLNDEDSAELLRCRRATVRSLIARGMQTLRGTLEA